MAQKNPIKIEKEDLRAVIKGELQKLWDKHYATTYPEFVSGDMYRLRFIKGRFILNIYKYLMFHVIFKSSINAMVERDDLHAMVDLLHRISPTILVKYQGDIIW